ncbi:hypothetical protein KR032_009166 [Drosophila birchii]|nr:hypothetical protein KR032_009166 [Drosophila birchii]
MDQDNATGEQELQAEEPNIEAALVPVSVKAIVRRLPKDMASYHCKHCLGYVRGGVILICGHMFCWSCLWPFVADETSPECPQCQTRLFLHEDIMPFYGEGPNSKPEESDFLADPGAVPRPSGVCFTAPEEEESVDEDEEEEEDALGDEQIIAPLDEEPLLQQQGARQFHWELSFPRIEYTVACLKWVQVICASLMLLIWCFVSIT